MMHSAAEKWLAALRPYAEKHMSGCIDARNTQLRLLRTLLESNEDCAFGQAFGFKTIGGYEEFKARVPLMNYEDLCPWIDRLAEGEQGLLTSEKVIGFEQTSGTTSARKLIPYTETFREQMAVAVGAWMYGWKERYPGVFDGKSYWAISPAGMEAELLESGVQVGMDGDGGYFPIAVAAPLAELLVFPELDGNYMEHTAKALLATHDLSSVSVWSPTFLLELDRQLRLLDPEFTQWSDYWHGLVVVSCWTDAQAGRWLPQLEDLLGKVVIEPKGLMSTEGVCSIPSNGGKAELAVSSHFYEFISEAGEVFLCDELKVGKSYEIVMTTGAGLYRYRTGDYIKVSSMKLGVPLFRFIGRGGSSDLVGEKLSEEFVSQCFIDAKMSGVLLANVDHYLLLSEDISQSEWLIKLLRTNPYYRQAIDLNQLKSMRCVEISSEKMFYWLEELAAISGARVGDVKLPSLISMDSPFHPIILKAL